MPPPPPIWARQDRALVLGAMAVDDSDRPGLENWSSFIGIVTSIIGNILIALALNVQRYSHIKLARQRTEARVRAKEALKRAQGAPRNGYGSVDEPSADLNGNTEEDADEDETQPLARSFQSERTEWTDQTPEEEVKVTSTYLKSASWWLGQVLMTVGEMGNFLAYGFAPASVVSPLGVVALVANCIIAPCFFGEHFRVRDFWGVIVAIAGAIAIVLSSKHKEAKLQPHDVWDHITATPFVVYMVLTIVGILVLMFLSPRYGKRTILIDLSLVGLFGGYTALSTKGVSSMLSSTLLKAFTTPVTYSLIAVLVVTAIMQVRYLNKALQRFDSTQVIPTQFVLFTLSVIIGSAVLYRDFTGMTGQQAIKFFGGCALTFFGVFLITSGRPPMEDEDQLSDDEDVEETIRLGEQEASGLPRPPFQSSHASSRRSSVGSRPGLGTAYVQHTSSRSSTAVSPTRSDAISDSNYEPNYHPATPPEESEFSQNPWDDQPKHPGLSTTRSSNSVATVHSIASLSVPAPMQSSISLPPPVLDTAAVEQPSTPPHRQSPSHSRPQSNRLSARFISPSPLSSTVSAVVSDALAREGDSTLPRKKSSRRMRPSVGSGLFVPRDDDEAAAVEPLLRSRTDRDAEIGDALAAGGRRDARRRANSLGHTLENFFSRRKGQKSRIQRPARDEDTEHAIVDTPESNPQS